jgi:tRNA dimethylallyltransferase
MKNYKNKTLVVLTGPTAVGKTDVSIELALRLQTEIISADARQFYRELQIGTASPGLAALQTVPHHFISHLSIHDYYNVSLFEQQALKKLDELFASKDFVVLTGGSGLYIDTLCHGIDMLPDPDARARQSVRMVYDQEGLTGLRMWLKRIDPLYYDQVDLTNPNRMMRGIEVYLMSGIPFSEWRKKQIRKRPFAIKKVVLYRPREELFARINKRVYQMLDQGLVEEALHLYPFRQLNALNTVGYKEIYDWLANKVTLHAAMEKIQTNTRRYAKRQLTWFKRYEDATWFLPEELAKIEKHVVQK